MFGTLYASYTWIFLSLFRFMKFLDILISYTFLSFVFFLSEPYTVDVSMLDVLSEVPSAVLIFLKFSSFCSD